MTHSTMTKVIEITTCVRFDCDTTTIQLWQKIDRFIFARVELHRMEQAHAIRRSRIVVVS